MKRFGAVGLYDYGQVPWFADAGARQQLGLNKLQFQHLRELYGERYATYLENLSGLRGRETTPRDRAEFQQFRQDFASDLRNSYAKVIKDPALRQRFNQLDLQYRGLNAFTTPSVQEHLDLTSRDVAELDALAEKLNAELAEIAKQYEQFPDQISEQFKRVQRDRDMELRRILGRERYAQWEELIGEHYEFPAAAYLPQRDRSGDDQRPQDEDVTTNADP